MTLSVLKAATYVDTDSNGEYYRVDEESIFLTKRINKDGNTIGANHPKKYTLDEFYEPNSLAQLCPLLTALSNDNKRLLIRYKFKDFFKKGDLVERRTINVESVPSKIVSMDIDELDLPEHIETLDIAGQGRYVCELLNDINPKMFPKGMGFIAQASSSAGKSNVIKLHLWICNAYEIEQDQLRNLFYNVNSQFKVTRKVPTPLVDTALYHSVQPHYTSNPIFEDPTQDPFTSRLFFEQGVESRIPKSYSPYVRAVNTSKKERNAYTSSIKGRLDLTKEVEKALTRVLAWPKDKAGLRIAVISLYHHAMQDSICLDYINERISPVVDLLRPGELNNYCDQGETSACNNIVACSKRELPTEFKGLKFYNISGGDDNKYLKIEEDLPKNSVTFLKATLGTGKTYSISEALKKGKIKGKFLALTDTSALVESNAKRFGAGDFRRDMDRLSFATGEIDRLSGTLHSLEKIKDQRFDFLFIDEADSLMNNLLFASIIAEDKKARIVEILKNLLIYTDRVVISDGDISEETVKAYIDLMEGSRNINRVNHNRKNLQGVVAYQHKTQGSLWGALEGKLSTGEKCLLVSDYSPKQLNEYYVAFKRIFPEKVIKVVHSASTKDPDIVDIINNTTDALIDQNVDALFCSPSITNGVDFNYFDNTFVSTITESHTPNMRYQAMMRERQPSEIHYFFRKLKKFNTGYSEIASDESFMDRARKIYALRREREYRTYTATFNYYLSQAGATIDASDSCWDNPLLSEDKDNYIQERVGAILTSTPASVVKRHNDAYEVKEQIQHYYNIVGEPSWEDCERFLKERPHDCAAFLHKLYKDFWGVLCLADPKKLFKYLQGDGGHKFYLACGESYSGGEQKAAQILKRCGIGEDTENAIYWYKKYCEIVDDAELPTELRDTEEEAIDLNGL